MWSVCSLQVSLFLHLSCRRCFLPFSSLLHAVSVDSEGSVSSSLTCFLLKVKLWPRPRRATGRHTELQYLPHTWPERQGGIPPNPGATPGAFSFALSVFY
ncbi:hypothetical protein F5Y04DRAFT_21009 [Hypomontagnella monticulosa]|nr:hypothetical protein F5Y04DRAFT_21009 [Hypomontagnella monticulosa]